MKVNADNDSLCNCCGNPGSITCGCGWEGCYERLCESCAAKPIPGRRFVDGGERPVVVVPGMTNTGYALLTEEERQHVRSGTAYVVKRHNGGRLEGSSPETLRENLLAQAVLRIAGEAPSLERVDTLTRRRIVLNGWRMK